MVSSGVKNFRNQKLKKKIKNGICWITNARRTHLQHTCPCLSPAYLIFCPSPFSKSASKLISGDFHKVCDIAVYVTTTQIPSHHSWLFSGLIAHYIFSQCTAVIHCQFDFKAINPKFPILLCAHISGWGHLSRCKAQLLGRLP